MLTNEHLASIYCIHASLPTARLLQAMANLCLQVWAVSTVWYLNYDAQKREHFLSPVHVCIDMLFSDSQQHYHEQELQKVHGYYAEDSFCSRQKTERSSVVTKRNAAVKSHVFVLTSPAPVSYNDDTNCTQQQSIVKKMHNIVQQSVKYTY